MHSVDPVQYTIRLLLPEGSLLLDQPELAPHLGTWDATRVTYEWAPRDATMDHLQQELASLVETSVAGDDSIPETYGRVREAVGLPAVEIGVDDVERPHLTETWFCCAEPTDTQFTQLQAVIT